MTKVLNILKVLLVVFIVLIFLYGIFNTAFNLYRYFNNLGHAQEQSLKCVAAPALDTCLKQYQYLEEADKNAHEVVSGAKSINDKVNK